MKIILEPGQKLFFTSDTHFGHSNICRATTKWADADGVTRDYDSLNKMNETLINNINKVVGPDDILFHLGDWSFGGIENIWEFRKRIICKNINIILGNHDHHIENDKITPNIWEDENGTIWEGKCPYEYPELFSVNSKKLFKSVNHYLNLEVLIPQGKNERNIRYNFVLCHYPIASWMNMNQGWMHLHGHVHLPEHQKVAEGRVIDVGCDGNNLKPYELSEIIRLLKDRPIKKLVLPKDHHEKAI